MPYFPEGPPAEPIKPAPDFAAFVDDYRATVPCLGNWAYLNHASVGPLSAWVETAVNVALEHQRMEFDTTNNDWFDYWRHTRQRVAELIGAHKDEICTLTSTYEGLMRAFDALPLGPGDEVLFPADEFPSLYYALSGLRERGCSVREVASAKGDGIVRTADLLDAVTPATKLIATSWVCFANGYVHDIDALGAACRERGAFLVLDVIQGLGQLTLDAKKCGAHFISGQGAKWMCAPLGSGFLYASDDMPREITPRQVGWFAMEHNHDDYLDRNIQVKDNANRFAMGTVPLPSVYGLRRASEILLEAGPERCQRRATELTDRIEAVAREAGMAVYSDRSERPCAIIYLEIAEGKDDPGRPDIKEKLDRAKVVYSIRSGRLRLSPHWYTSDAEIDTVCEIIQSEHA
jgi:selenocysteine lyase/cysteine desulfurase